MNNEQKILLRIYARLIKRFGCQNWWPARTPFEVMVGAILTQNTAWTNAEKAINNLKRLKCLSINALSKINGNRLATLIRPSGYFNQKAKKLKNFVRFMLGEFFGDVQKMKAIPLKKMRERLLSLNGIGPETADSILLYALGKKIFVVDSYTKRILERVGAIGTDWNYCEIQSFLMENLPLNIKLYNDYHAQLVNLGKNFCRKKPLCHACPVLELCRFGRKTVSNYDSPWSCHGVTSPSSFDPASQGRGE